MAGVYSHNKLFYDFCWMATEMLPEFEDDVHTDLAVTTTGYEDYEVALEESWPDFIKTFYA